MRFLAQLSAIRAGFRHRHLPDLRGNRRMRLVFDHLVAAFTAYAKAGSGPD